MLKLELTLSLKKLYFLNRDSATTPQSVIEGLGKYVHKTVAKHEQYTSGHLHQVAFIKGSLQTLNSAKQEELTCYSVWM